MSANIERIAGTRLNELGSPVISDINYRHHKADKSKYQLKQNEDDCISCNKHITHKIPNKQQCRLICSITHRTTKSTNVALTSKDQ